MTAQTNSQTIVNNLVSNALNTKTDVQLSYSLLATNNLKNLVLLTPELTNNFQVIYTGQLLDLNIVTAMSLSQLAQLRTALTQYRNHCRINVKAVVDAYLLTVNTLLGIA
jgi:hypothetical protein